MGKGRAKWGGANKKTKYNIIIPARLLISTHRVIECPSAAGAEDVVVVVFAVVIRRVVSRVFIDIFIAFVNWRTEIGVR